MPYNPDIHHRRSIRLAGYDYASEGAYFITIRAQVREPWFGIVQDGEANLNDAGQMVTTIWHDLPERFPHIALDACIIMPDHLHGIVFIVNQTPAALLTNQPSGTLPGTIGRVVQAFKSLSTRAYINGVQRYGWQPFAGKLWQRNYYEHIIRNEQSLQNVREYIASNPTRWTQQRSHS